MISVAENLYSYLVLYMDVIFHQRLINGLVYRPVELLGKLGDFGCSVEEIGKNKFYSRI
jgi:hypothetical protein